MRGILLFVVAMLLLFIGAPFLQFISYIYIKLAHPDGLTYWGFIWRELLFGVPDLILLFSMFFLLGAAVMISPYRKAVSVVVLLLTFQMIWHCFHKTGEIESMPLNVVHIISGFLSALVGFFSKADESEVTLTTS